MNLHVSFCRCGNDCDVCRSGRPSTVSVDGVDCSDHDVEASVRDAAGAGVQGLAARARVRLFSVGLSQRAQRRFPLLPGPLTALYVLQLWLHNAWAPVRTFAGVRRFYTRERAERFAEAHLPDHVLRRVVPVSR